MVNRVHTFVKWGRHFRWMSFLCMAFTIKILLAVKKKNCKVRKCFNPRKFRAVRMLLITLSVVYMIASIMVGH